MPDEKEQKKEKPFYKTKEFWLEVAKIVAQSGIVFGAAYLANKGKQK